VGTAPAARSDAPGEGPRGHAAELRDGRGLERRWRARLALPGGLWQRHRGRPRAVPENEPIALSQEIDFTPKPAGPGEGSVADFAVADWDQDGHPDLLVRQRLPDGKRGIYWYKNLGGPGLTKLAEAKLLVGDESLADVRGFCVCDWNGDGWPDLIVTRDELVPGNTPDERGHWRGSVLVYLRE
jgi:FG-GAP-like repeat